MADDPSLDLDDIPWPAIFAEHRRYLWSVCYRLTGDASDAEDLVQGTFERAMRRPPEDLDRPWRPWLTRVASNLAIDLLRRRSQQAYDGPWLPAPVEELLEVEGWTRDHHGPGDPSPESVEVRYGQLESARIAFLLALEALDPRARAVVILRDVLGYSGPEVAEFLQLTPANVRVILHRARKALEQARGQPQTELREALRDEQLREVIEQFMTALLSGDSASLERMLADDVRATSDAGGEFVAARNVVRGRASVQKLMLGLAKFVPVWFELRSINGEPGLVYELPPLPIRTARHGVLHVELDGDLKICEVQVVLATRKLAAVSLSPTPV